jgi:hypothetical protein
MAVRFRPQKIKTDSKVKKILSLPFFSFLSFPSFFSFPSPLSLFSPVTCPPFSLFLSFFLPLRHNPSSFSFSEPRAGANLPPSPLSHPHLGRTPSLSSVTPAQLVPHPFALDWCHPLHNHLAWSSSRHLLPPLASSISFPPSPASLVIVALIHPLQPRLRNGANTKADPNPISRPSPISHTKTEHSPPTTLFEAASWQQPALIGGLG